ncbi:MAG: DNA repair exonuclease [Clostridia bacterium]
MEKITFFHCGDIHLDWKFSSLSDKPGLPKERREDILRSFLGLIGKAKEKKPDFLFVAGDLFEQEYTSSRTMLTLVKAFSEIPSTRVVLIPGNHDFEAGNSFYKTTTWNENVFFLGEENHCRVFEAQNTCIHGIGFGPGHGQSHRIQGMRLDPGRINILLFHGDIDLKIGQRDYNAVTSGMLASKNFDYVAAGHTHGMKKDIGGHKMIFNPGSLEPLGFDEPGVHGYFEGSLEKGKPPAIEFIPHAGTVYIEEKADITGISSDEELEKLLASRMDDRKALYKMILTGKKPLFYQPDSRAVGKKLADKCRYVKIRDDSKTAVTREELALMKGLRGSFARLMLEKMEKSRDGDEVILLGRALHYGITAIEEGRLDLDFGEDS